MYRRIGIVIGVLLFVFCLRSGAQDDRPFRIEFQAPEEVYPYDVINLGKKGVVVYFENEAISKTQINWRFIYYDVYFRKQWVVDVPLPKTMEPALTFADSTRLALLFKYEGKKKSTVLHQFVTIQLKDTISHSIAIPFNKEVIPNVLYATSDRAFFSYYKDDDEQFFSLNYADGQTKSIQFPELKKAFVQFVKPIPNSSQLMVAVRNDLGKKINELCLYRISMDGLIVHKISILPSQETFFNKLTAIQLSEDSVLLIGSYVLTNSISGGFLSPSSEQNTGLFSALMVDFKIVDSVRFFNFAYNKTIFKYLSSKEQDKMKKKLENTNKEDVVSLNLQLMVHDPVSTDSAIVVLCEAYYPEYRTEENVNYDFYGRPFPNNRTYFEGYRYTNSIVCGFNRRGVLIWDNNFSLNELISYELKHRVALCPDSNVVLLAFSNDGNINTAAISGYKVVQNPERSRIEPLNSSDFIVKTEKPQIEFWYENYCLSYGYQKIRGSGKGSKNRDNAFFLNKMIYKGLD